MSIGDGACLLQRLIDGEVEPDVRHDPDDAGQPPLEERAEPLLPCDRNPGVQDAAIPAVALLQWVV